jgi:asparagine synthase (glutamine-hydrolysing)
MCGICGFIDFGDSADASEARAVLERMMLQLRHRGPDDSGTWMDPESRVFLGHTRLAVIDLSPEGRQPMTSACGRYVVVFNGEIYNHRDIRSQLDLSEFGISWRGHSDTETMLAAVSCWGLSAALRRFNGMFSFALWDKRERALHLVRDRVGEKPVYYGWMGDLLLFGSELKALRAHPKWRGRIDRNALALFMRHNYVPAPFSIYEGIKKLPPAAVVTFRRIYGQQWPEPSYYWSFREIAEFGCAHPFQGGFEQAKEVFHDLLMNAVGLRMQADVPLGAFLSGGVDSSTVVALMQAQSLRPVNTFSIGFKEASSDEAGFARAVATHLGTAHTELYVTPREAMDVIPNLPTLYDEPFADVSQIPTFLVSQLARRHVTVALSGDGGDELFGGYDRYQKASRLWAAIGWVPQEARIGIASMLESLRPRPVWQKVAGVLRTPSKELLYRRLITNWNSPETQIVLEANEPATRLSDPSAWPKLSDFKHYMMYQDTVGYLPDDILVKLDRASMAVSLEGRVPLLDHRIVELAWRLPTAMKMKRGQTKRLLRQVLERYLPGEMFDRPKMGFGVPIGSWLRGPLRDWAEDLLAESRLREAGFLCPAPIRTKWLEHLAGRQDWQYHLWEILMFQAWLENERLPALPQSTRIPVA